MFPAETHWLTSVQPVVRYIFGTVDYPCKFRFEGQIAAASAASAASLRFDLPRVS